MSIVIKNTAATIATQIDHEAQLKELQAKFARLVRNLGFNNAKGTVRHQFEVDFAYAVREVVDGPNYLRAKMLDKVSNIIANLITHLKQTAKPEAEEVTA
jgi:hypothetical protein